MTKRSTAPAATPEVESRVASPVPAETNQVPGASAGPQKRGASPDSEEEVTTRRKKPKKEKASGKEKAEATTGAHNTVNLNIHYGSAPNRYTP